MRTTVHERTITRWEEGSIPEKHWHELAEIFAVSVPHLLGMDAEDDGDGLRSVA